MKPLLFALPRLRLQQYGFVLFAMAFGSPVLSVHAEETESDEPPVVVLTRTVQPATGEFAAATENTSPAFSFIPIFAPPC